MLAAALARNGADEIEQKALLHLSPDSGLGKLYLNRKPMVPITR